jgi:NSS family neurotransmitter:Na+ symporter
MAGENGGGAFVLFYLLCVFLVGLPVMVAEILIGRRGRRNPVATMRIVGEEEGSLPQWGLVGVIGILAGFLILSFYSVVAGWSLAYVGYSIRGAYAGGDPEAAGRIFADLLGNWQLVGFWHTVFMGATVFVVARGVERGLETAVRFLVPALVVLLLVLLGYAILYGDFGRGVEFMFSNDFSGLGPEAMLVALGQAFFTLSIGMGAIMAYGAYLPEGTSIGSTSIAVVIADTIIAMLAGLVVFPIVFANNLDPASGPGLLFETLPIAFGQMKFGLVSGTLFFILLVITAWTSAIGLIEPAVAWSVETRGQRRATAAVMIGTACWAVGFLTILSFNELSEITLFGRGVFDNIDYLASNILLPLGGLLITCFAGWVMCKNSTAEELDPDAGAAYRLWRFLARWVAPAAVLIVLLHAAGVLGRFGLV